VEAEARADAAVGTEPSPFTRDLRSSRRHLFPRVQDYSNVTLTYEVEQPGSG
jgi:hypothetical protein